MTCILLLPSPKGTSIHVHKLLQSMVNDDTAYALKNDPLTLDIAKQEFMKHGHDQDDTYVYSRSATIEINI